MRKKPTALILVVVGAIVALVGLNMLAVKSRTQPPPQQTPAPHTPARNNEGHQPLLTGVTMGDPQTASTRVVIGYTADPYVEENVDNVNKMLESALGWARITQPSSVQIVCVDIPPAMRVDPSTKDVPVGMTVNGKLVPGSDHNIGPDGLTVPLLQEALMAKR